MGPLCCLYVSYYYSDQYINICAWLSILCTTFCLYLRLWVVIFWSFFSCISGTSKVLRLGCHMKTFHYCYCLSLKEWRFNFGPMSVSFYFVCCLPRWNTCWLKWMIKMKKSVLCWTVAKSYRHTHGPYKQFKQAGAWNVFQDFYKNFTIHVQ